MASQTNPHHRRETLSRMIDEAQAMADKAFGRGQFKAAAKHQAKVGRLLQMHDEAPPTPEG